MLQVLGLGFAYPKNQITNDLISELNPNFLRDIFEKETGIKSRHSILDLEYLKQTSNSDVSKGLSHLLESDLTVAERAVNRALHSAGVEMSEIGLVIGETSTPFQTIPALSQRVAGHMKHKVKAYDLMAGAASPCLHFDTLNSFNIDKLPEYILLIYSNFPTAFIDYAAVTPNMARYSDSVAAVVIGTQRRGMLKLLDCYFNSKTNFSARDEIDLLSPLRISSSVEAVFESEINLNTQKALSKNPRAMKKNYFVPSQISPKLIRRLGQVLGFAGDELMINDSGDSFSSAPFKMLFEHWGKFSSGERIYMSLCGFGLQSGYLVFEVN